MSPAELTAKPHGSVVYAPDEDRYLRKGPRDTWHPISRVDGQRSGQRDAIRSSYLEAFFGVVTDASAECERLTAVR